MRLAVHVSSETRAIEAQIEASGGRGELSEDTFVEQPSTVTISARGCQLNESAGDDGLRESVACVYSTAGNVRCARFARFYCTRKIRKRCLFIAFNQSPDCAQLFRGMLQYSLHSPSIAQKKSCERDNQEIHFLLLPFCCKIYAIITKYKQIQPLLVFYFISVLFCNFSYTRTPLF